MGSGVLVPAFLRMMWVKGGPGLQTMPNPYHLGRVLDGDCRGRGERRGSVA